MISQPTARGGNMGRSIVMTAPLRLQTCLWVACYARCQPWPWNFLNLAGVRAGAEGDTSPRLAFTVASIMAKSIKVASKRRGRPSTGGRDPGIHVRLPEDMLSTVDAWSASKAVTRSEAIRRLVELGLKKGK